MGFCKPGDPCFGVLGGFSLQKILDYQNQGRNKAEDCGIDTSSLDFCNQINNCITGSSIHTSLTACTVWTDMIMPCETGTTINSLLQVTGAISAQTDTYIHGHIYSGTTNLLDIFCAKPCSGGSSDPTLSACTLWSDMIIPCDTGTTINGLLQVTGTLTAQTDTYILGKAAIDGKVGVGTRTPDYELDVEGDIGVSEYIYHNDDNDTYIKFALDEINIVAGNKSFIKMTEASTDKIVINNSGGDLDLQVKGENDDNLIRTDAANDWIGIGTSSPTQKLTVEGSVAVSNAAHLDMVVPYSTGTTVDGLLQVTGAISAQTDTYVHGHIYSGTTNLLDIFCAKPCGSGGGSGVGLNDGYWSANTAGGISNSGGTRVGIGTTTPSSIFEVYEHLKFPAINDVYLGYLSGKDWEATSHSNTALGALSMGSHVSTVINGAVSNTAVGMGSLGFIETGDNNTALGTQAHQGITTGEENVSVGNLSQFTNTTNNKNVAVGMNTLRFVVNFGTGADMGDSYNTAIGHSSQYYSVSSMFNTSVGAKSIGNGLVSVGSTGNTAVGYEAMKSSQQGSFNTAVGYQAGDSITTGKFNITIGNTADVGVATGNYQLNIGDIIYGQDSYDDDAISQIGINTALPNKTFTVVGEMSGTSALYLALPTTYISGGTGAGADLELSCTDDIELYAGDDIVLNATEKVKFTELGAAQPSLQIDLNDNSGSAIFENGADDMVIGIDDGSRRLYFYDLGGEYIVGNGSDIQIAAGDDIQLKPTDDVEIYVGATAYAQFDGGTTSLNVGAGATPSGKIQASGALAGGSFLQLGEDCAPVSHFFVGRSTSFDESNLYVSELDDSGSGDIFLYSGPTSAEAAVNLDLVLGAFRSRDTCATEMIRLDGDTLLVGVNNSNPVRQLDVSGSFGASTVVAATISATTEFRIHTANPAGGATVSPNIYWFANCDAQSFGPASDGSFPSTNTTDVSWAETHNSHAGVYSFSAEELTIKRAGLYRITYNVTLEGGADGTTSNRTGGGIALLVNGAVVDGTESYVYCRISTIERNTGSVTVVYDVTANDVFKIVFIRTGAQTSTSKLGTITAGTAWTVEAVT